MSVRYEKFEIPEFLRTGLFVTVSVCAYYLDSTSCKLCVATTLHRFLFLLPFFFVILVALLHNIECTHSHTNKHKAHTSQIHECTVSTFRANLHTIHMILYTLFAIIFRKLWVNETHRSRFFFCIRLSRL